MSNATIFTFPYNLFLQQRLEFVAICHDQLAATIMRIIEYEMIKQKEAWQDAVVQATEDKKPAPREPKAYWVRFSHAQIFARLYLYDSGKLQKPEDENMESPAWQEYRHKKNLSISLNTLKKAITLLTNLGFLKMRSKQGDEFGAPLYTLLRENVQRAIDALPKNPYTIFLPGGGVSKFDSGGECQILTVGGLSNSDSGDNQNLTVGLSNSDSGDNQNLIVNIDNRDKNLFKEGYVAAATAQQPPAPNFFEPFEPSDPVEPEQAEPLHIANGTTSTVPFPVLPDTPMGTFRRSSTQPQVPAVPHGRAPRSLHLVPSGGEEMVQESLLPGEQGAPSETYSHDGYTKPAGGKGGKAEQANAAAAPEPGNGGRARKKQVSSAEVEKYLVLLDKLGRETTYKDASGKEFIVWPNGYGHTGVDKEHVKTLLKNNLREETPDYVNPDKLTAVYRHMASLPPEDGYHWAAKGMSIKSVCNNYARFANELIQAARRKQQQPPPALPAPTEKRPIRYVGIPSKPTRPRAATS